jgi:hypothetical protein
MPLLGAVADRQLERTILLVALSIEVAHRGMGASRAKHRVGRDPRG